MGRWQSLLSPHDRSALEGYCNPAISNLYDATQYITKLFAFTKTFCLIGDESRKQFASNHDRAPPPAQLRDKPEVSPSCIDAAFKRKIGDDGFRPRGAFDGKV
jgi:hypothetical protein